MSRFLLLIRWFVLSWVINNITLVCLCIFLNSNERVFHLNRILGDIFYKMGQSASATLLRTNSFLLTLFRLFIFTRNFKGGPAKFCPVTIAPKESFFVADDHLGIGGPGLCRLEKPPEVGGGGTFSLSSSSNLRLSNLLCKAKSCKYEQIKR